ncbi:MAG: LCP family protein [Clostridiaceae bacterium]
MDKSIKKFKSHKGISAIAVILSVILVIAAAAIGYSYYLSRKTNKVKIDEKALDVQPQTDSQYKDIINIALFGINSTAGQPGRSDSIIILTIDKTRNNARISTIMKDSYVTIKDHGENKISNAYAYGGPELAISTINTNFNLNVKDFLALDSSNLPKIIDYLGGVNISLTSEDLPYINRYIDYINSANKTSYTYITTEGTHNLDGNLAIAYTGIRSQDREQEGNLRSKIVLEALLNRINTYDKSKYPALLEKLLPLVKTSFSGTDLLKLIETTSSLSSFQEDRFPRDDNGKSTMINGVYYQVFDKEITKKQMHDFIFEGKKSG